MRRFLFLLLPFFLTACVTPRASEAEKILPAYDGHWLDNTAKHGISFDIDIDREHSTIKTWTVHFTEKPLRSYLNQTDSFKVIHNDVANGISYILVKSGPGKAGHGYHLVSLTPAPDPDSPWLKGQFLWASDPGCTALTPLEAVWEQFNAVAIWEKIRPDGGSCAFTYESDGVSSQHYHRN